MKTEHEWVPITESVLDGLPTGTMQLAQYKDGHQATRLWAEPERACWLRNVAAVYLPPLPAYAAPPEHGPYVPGIYLAEGKNRTGLAVCGKAENGRWSKPGAQEWKESSWFDFYTITAGPFTMAEAVERLVGAKVSCRPATRPPLEDGAEYHVFINKHGRWLTGTWTANTSSWSVRFQGVKLFDAKVSVIGPKLGPSYPPDKDKIAELKAEVERLTANATTYQTALAEHDSETERVVARLQDASARCDRKADELADARRWSRDRECERNRANSKNTKLRIKLAHAEERRDEMARELEGAKARHRDLLAAVDRYTTSVPRELDLCELRESADAHRPEAPDARA